MRYIILGLLIAVPARALTKKDLERANRTGTTWKGADPDDRRASGPTLCPDGKYVKGEECVRCQDGSYKDHECERGPDGLYY